jgi:asparagine synthase (glutamine-hydrolysing)
MCGIAGIVHLDNSPVDPRIVKMMMRVIKHRGPDDEGVFVKDNCSLGHVRLSIQDLSKAGHQPMFSNDERYCIIFNGEIYNYIELKQELTHKYKFKTKTDTEVILAAYTEWGALCLDKFNGDWAFVIYDRDQKEYFGARDRYGVKPFYYYLDSDQFIFASEIKAIIPTLATRTENNKLIYEYLVYNRTDQSDETFFHEIKKLKHGRMFTIKDNNYVESQWYNLRDKVNSSTMSAQDYRATLRDSIKLRLRSDVPLGVSLSGGLDSSAITSIVTQDLGLKDLKTFSAIYDPGDWADESIFINEYKDELNHMHFISPSASSFFEDFPGFIHAQGEPIASIGPYAQYKVMQLAKGHVTVTLDGQGADEQLAGYHNFYGSYFKELISNYNFTTATSEIYHYLALHKSLYGIKYLGYYYLPDFLKKFVGSQLFGSMNSEYTEQWGSSSTIGQELYNPTSLNNSLIDHFEFKLEHLLKWDDLNAMNFSIESRVPFLDHNLVEATLSLPSEMKIKNGYTKHILRESLKDILPTKISGRIDKKGFSTPSDNWFRSEKFKEYIYDTLRSSSFRQRGIFDADQCLEKYDQHLNKSIDITKDIWKWINLDVWFKNNIESPVE